MKNLKSKSGIEEEYTEKDQLLQEVNDLMKEYGGQSKEKQNEIRKGKEARDKWSTILDKESSIDCMIADDEVVFDPEYCGPTRSRQRRLNIQRQGLHYLEEYDQRQFKIKEKDQELEERKLALEERRLILEERNLNWKNLKERNSCRS